MEISEDDGDEEGEDEESLDEEGEAEMEEGELEMDEEEDDIEKYLDDQDEEEEMLNQIKIPSDLEDADDEYGGEDDEDKRGIDEDEEFGQFADEQAEDEVFQMARENKEMVDPKVEAAAAAPASYTNPEMIGRIEKLENSMLLGKDTSTERKGWQLTGETTAN